MICDTTWQVTEFLRSHPSRAVPPPRESGSQLCGVPPQDSDTPTSTYHFCITSRFSSCFSISPTPVEPILYKKIPNVFSVFLSGSYLTCSPPAAPLCFLFFFVLPTLLAPTDGRFQDSITVPLSVINPESTSNLLSNYPLHRIWALHSYSLAENPSKVTSFYVSPPKSKFSARQGSLSFFPLGRPSLPLAFTCEAHGW